MGWDNVVIDAGVMFARLLLRDMYLMIVHVSCSLFRIIRHMRPSDLSQPSPLATSRSASDPPGMAMC